MPYILLTWIFFPLLCLLQRWRPAKPHKHILVIQKAKIGDFVCSTAVFRALRQAYPDCQLDVMINPVNEDLAKLNPNIDNCLIVTEEDFQGWSGKLRLACRLYKARYSTCICLNAGLALPLIAVWAGIPERAAILPNFGAGIYRYAVGFWTTTVTHRGDRLIQDSYSDLLRVMGVTGCSRAKEVYWSAEADGKVSQFLPSKLAMVIGIGVSSGNKLKELGTEKLKSVVEGLLSYSDDLTVVLVGSSMDRGQAECLLSAFPGEQRVLSLCGWFSLAELPALLSRLDLYIGVDSGITYMADALGIPIVSVSGPCNMDETRPIGESVILLHGNPDCYPCAHIFKAPYSCQTGHLNCITEVDASKILGAAFQLLSGTKGLEGCS